MLFIPPQTYDANRWAGRRIGLLGGSFNPPHRGHVHISQIARKMLGLDVIWWLLTPQNPLKDDSVTQSFTERLNQCEAITRDPRLIVSDLEQQWNVTITYNTLSLMKYHFPRSKFIWITGMDNALTFHTWNHWREILDLMPTAHIARPPAWSLIRNCPLKMLKTQNHVYLDHAVKPALEPLTTYWILSRKMLDLSSTTLRLNNSYQ